MVLAQRIGRPTVVPRLRHAARLRLRQGTCSTWRLELPLVRLALYLRDGAVPTAADADTTVERGAVLTVFPDSFRRTVEMLETLRGYGFVSFFK
jgi:hypothetical protein